MEATGYSRDTGGVERDWWIDVATRNLLIHQKKPVKKYSSGSFLMGLRTRNRGRTQFLLCVFVFFSHFERLAASPMMPTWIFSDFTSNFCVWKSLTNLYDSTEESWEVFFEPPSCRTWWKRICRECREWRTVLIQPELPLFFLQYFGILRMEIPPNTKWWGGWI